jgi:hypothetical protein
MNENIKMSRKNDSINLLEFITELTSNDPYVCVEYSSISQETIVTNYIINNLLDLMIHRNFLKSISDDVISHMIDLLFLFKQNINNNTANLILLCDTLINCIPNKTLMLQILNHISHEIKNEPFYVLLYKIVNDPILLKKIYKFILDMSTHEEYYNYILSIKNYMTSSFIVNHNSLFLTSQYKKPIIQFYKGPNISPEHQWFIEQLSF